MAAETIPGLLAARAQDSAGKPAIIDDGGVITYAELDLRSAALAAELVARGVNKGHRTALLAPNGIDWAVAAYAVMRIGAALVPLSTLLRPPELQRQLEIAGVRHLILVDEFRGRRYVEEVESLDRASLPSLANVWRWDELASAPNHATDLAMVQALEARVAPADDMAVIFTSGSIGEPKGVIHTHGGAIRRTRAGLSVRCIDAETRLYIPMPFFWVGGFGTGLLSTLIAGATLLTERAPEPERTIRFLGANRATLFRGWPDQAAKIAADPAFEAADLSSLRAGSLEAVLPPKLRGPTGARASLLGMTETFGPYCGWPLDQDMPQSAWGSCGRPFDDVQVRIVDPDTGALVAEGEAGAIQVRGPNLLRGVCGRDREQVFTPDLWFDTGDGGRLDADGFLFFIGRRDDMVKVRGASVYPSEVEAALVAIPGVARAFACGIDVDGAAAIGAAVLPAAGVALDIAGLKAAARERLSAFKLPARWTLLESLNDVPTSATGKLDRAAFQALLSRGEA